MKKIIFLVLIILLISAGGFFWWQENQKDVKELNKNLPEGVRVVKSFLGEYKVINKIDGYEFKVPKVWDGLSEIEYTPERIEGEYTGASTFIMGKQGQARALSVDTFKLENDEDPKQWGQKFFDNFGLTGTFEEEKIRNLIVSKTIEEKHLGGSYIYLVKSGLKIYVFNGGSEDFIREIIASGKW